MRPLLISVAWYVPSLLFWLSLFAPLLHLAT